MRRTIATALLCAFMLARAFAIEPFTVKDIRVEGLQRIAAGTVFNYLPTKVGDTITEDRAQEAIRALFKTGFFNDVRLERRGDVLVVIVNERPSIDSIKINGVKDIDEKTLKKTLKELGLSEGLIFNSSLLDKVEQELKRQYFNRGRYAVKVTPTITPLERNRVAIVLDVSEGPVTKIEEINIIGNKAFNDKKLLDTFSLSPPTLFSFFSKNDQYSKQKLSADLEKLRSFYQNQGYLEFNIESTQVSVTPDKERIYITINITEGEKYTVSGFKVAGKLPVAEQELRKLIAIKPGEIFSRQVVTDSSKKISDRLGNDGYAFANVNAVPEVDKTKRTVELTFFVDPGQRVYVRRVNFSGNVVTRDEVMRREMRQLEGAQYSAQKIQRSIARLRRLGFFEEVTVETPSVPGSPDQVDVNVTVKERHTGTLVAGIGYSDAEGVMLNANVNFKNFVGTGKEVSVNVDSSPSTKNFNITYVNPFYTPEGVSRGFNIFSTKVNTAESLVSTAAYNSSTQGVGVFYGIPISEERSINVGLAFESVEFDVRDTSAQIAQDFVARYGAVNNLVKGTLGWAYDSLDDPIFPKDGVLHRLSTEVSLPGSALEYYRLTYLAAWYYPLSQNFTFKIKGEIGYGGAFGDTEELPFYKNFFAGGSSSVRGYRARSLGPRDGLTPHDPVGGSKRVLTNMELLFPVPGASDNKSMRLSTFVDGGMVYGPHEAVELDEMRYSVGLAFHWFTPVGPISFSWAHPVKPQAEDKTDRQQFTLGVPFR